MARTEIKNFNRLGLDVGVFATKGVLMEGNVIKKKIIRTNGGSFLKVAKDCLDELLADFSGQEISFGITGSNANLIAREMSIDYLLEIEALQAGLDYFNLNPQGLLSLGHENMYYLELDHEGNIQYFNRNGQCAAGSGAFWYQQATRMGYNDKEMAEIALQADSAVKISGRCAVFAKSDMTHAINEGALQSSVAAGLAQALVDLVVTSIGQNRIKDLDPLMIIGGVANNKAVLKYFQNYCLDANVKIEIPAEHEHIEALGAAEKGRPIAIKDLQFDRLLTSDYKPDNPLPPLDKNKVHYLEANFGQENYDLSRVYLGVDCGSVSTKCALLDKQGKIIGGEYLPTAGRPALQVLALMQRVKEKYGDMLKDVPFTACTTGSGRFLSQKILNADYAIDEITCQAQGVKNLFPADKTLSIIEIGGEDSKFIQLQDGILADYNMNPVCAAGTGTFLENLAELLGVNIKEEFSAKAFTADYAIDLGDTCTLLSQSTLVTEAARGLPLESQLASLAYSSAQNYISRTIENRALEGKLVFTGATAKNHALAAALAAAAHKELYIPPLPELSGAIGSALMAKTMRENGEVGEYSMRNLDDLNSFQIKKQACRAKCPHDHNCNLDIISFADGNKFIYGDRCGRYSDLMKKDKESSLPDYEKKWQDIFYDASPQPNTTGTRVGIARSGLFFDLYPFFAAFFKTLGARVILSEETNEATLSLGKTKLNADMCYPAEVLMGHYGQLAREDLDYIFIPEVVTMEALPWAEDWPRSFTCPLLQTFHRVAQKSLALKDEKILYAEIYFRDGRDRVLKNMRSTAQKLLGASFSEEILAKAIDQGYAALRNHERGMAEAGREAFARLLESPDDIVALFLGRSYTLYDSFVAKGSFTYARQRGLLALPQDFLFSFIKAWYKGSLQSPTLEKYRQEFIDFMADMVGKLENIYPAQLQKMLSAALMAVFFNERAARDGLPTFNIVLQDPFKCGPNAMLRHYLSTITGFLRLTLDEHTAPAGLITRLEAFKNTRKESRTLSRPTFYSAKNVYAHDKSWRKILIPDPSHHSGVFAALFENYGVEAAMLPRSTDKDLTLARRYSNGEECLPFLQNVQDMLEYLETNGDEEGSVMFQGWACGPCRYGLYAPTQSLAVNRAGYGEGRVCALKLEDVIKRFGLDFVLGAYDGTVTLDLLYKMLFATRPYEKVKGSAEELFEYYWQKLFNILLTKRFPVRRAVSGRHLRPLTEFLQEAGAAFMELPRNGEVRPRILVGGEFYVRLDDRNNQDLIKKIEEAGGEASLAPASELFAYTAHIMHFEARKKYLRRKNPLTFINSFGTDMLSRLAKRDEHKLAQAGGAILRGLKEPAAQQIMINARKYVSEHYGGEPPMTMGRAAAFKGREKVAGVIFVAPFTCMPGSVVEAQQIFLQEDLGLPIITIYYDGRENANREEFIKSLVFQAKQNIGL